MTRAALILALAASPPYWATVDGEPAQWNDSAGAWYVPMGANAELFTEIVVGYPFIGTIVMDWPNAPGTKYDLSGYKPGTKIVISSGEYVVKPHHICNPDLGEECQYGGLYIEPLLHPVTAMHSPLNILSACVRTPDLNSDGFVDVLDVLMVMQAWGTTTDGSALNNVAEDIAGPDGDGPDGVVNVHDLLALLGEWTR